MSDVFSDTYWTKEFEITEADLDRIAGHIEETGQAHDLTTLAQRVVRGRLRHGPETSAAAQATWSKDPSVRLWDPAAEWKVGDRVVAARRVGQRHETCVGEIIGHTTVQREGRTIPALVLQLDGQPQPRKYELAAPGSEDAEKWYRKVREVVEGQRASADTEQQAQAILLQHGERIVSQLLEALQGDARFLTLEGRWFLRDLLIPLSEAQRDALYRQLLERGEPASTNDLIALMKPPVAEGDVGRFSLYASLSAHPDRFANVGAPTRPQWKAVPPPPERAVGAYYAYDPETYAILLRPGQRLGAQLAQRLQDLGLYNGVVRPADEHEQVSG
ncbi:MAG: hypothetical protein ACUVXG_01835 [Anaerolineae bacterium]